MDLNLHRIQSSSNVIRLHLVSSISVLIVVWFRRRTSHEPEHSMLLMRPKHGLFKEISLFFCLKPNTSSCHADSVSLEARSQNLYK